MLGALHSDVLVVAVPVPSPYPSVNHTGNDALRRGRKSESYRNLYAAVIDEALLAMQRCGWSKAVLPVRTAITRYKPTAVRSDASNIGKCELDALTAAGVWEDDALARPLTLDQVFAPNTTDRIVIVIQKLGEIATPTPERTVREEIKSGDVMDAADFRSEVRSGRIRGVNL